MGEGQLNKMALLKAWLIKKQLGGRWLIKIKLFLIYCIFKYHSSLLHNFLHFTYLPDYKICFSWDIVGLSLPTSPHFILNNGAVFYKPTVLNYPPSHVQEYYTCNSARLEFPTIFIPALIQMKARVWTLNLSVMGPLPSH